MKFVFAGLALMLAAAPLFAAEKSKGDTAMETVRHIGVAVQRPANDVYAFASNPANLPKWASGLGGSIKKEGDDWFADSPMGRIKIRMAGKNTFGVLDHDVTLESGQTFHNPLRVLPNGAGCEVVFTLFRQPDMTDEKFEEDAATILKDLTALKRLMEK